MTSSSLPDSSSDAALVARMRAGDEPAFAALFGRYAKVLFDVAMRYVATRDVAQDLVQDVFCRLWEQRGDLHVRETLRVYLYASIRHAALDYLKHARIEQRVADSAPAADEYPGMSRPSALPDRQLLDEERHRLIEAAVEALPERQRMVFLLRWQHQLSYAEIGAIMGLSQKGVESARARALESLREKLRGVLDD